MRISDWSSDVCSSDLIACPLLSTERELVAGDVLWVDCGIVHHGFHSDFGRTWVVGQEPTARQQAQYARWNEINDAVLAVLRAGVPASEITAAAMAVCDGDQPRMPPFYIGHGLGPDSPEAAYASTDPGDGDARHHAPR